MTTDGRLEGHGVPVSGDEVFARPATRLCLLLLPASCSSTAPS